MTEKKWDLFNYFKYSNDHDNKTDKTIVCTDDKMIGNL